MDEILEYFQLATSAGKMIRCFETLRKIAVVFGFAAALLGVVKTAMLFKTDSKKKNRCR